MTLDPKKAEAYIKRILAASKDSPDSLTKHERRLADKYNASQDRVGKLRNDMQTMQNQIQQGEARLRSMELQVQSEGGKANGLLEALLAIEFDEDVTTAPPASAKGNGAADPAPPAGRRAKSKKRSKKPAQATA